MEAKPTKEKKFQDVADPSMQRQQNQNYEDCSSCYF